MEDRMCIRCREPLGERRWYTWISREQEFSHIAQIVIEELVTNQVPPTDFICRPCWQRAERAYQRVLREERQENVVVDENQAVQAEPRTVPLPGFKRTPNTTVHCVFEHCQNPSRLRIPQDIILRLLCRYKLFITENGRVCEEHLQQNIWHELLLQNNLTEEFTPSQIVNALNLTINRIASDFLNFEEYEDINDSEFHTWIGLTKEQFSSLLENVPSLNDNRRKKTILAAVLAKMRTGDSNLRLASIFRTSESTFHRMLQEGREALITDYVPSRVGFNHMTREDVVRRNLLIPERLFGNPQSPVIERKAVTMCDGTYIYHQKSSNYFFQRKSYSSHKYRNLLKPMLYVCCDGHIIEVSGPHAATTSDAVIMNNTIDDEEGIFHWFYRPGDVFILDRGFRDSKRYLEEYEYVVHMPELKHPRETQLTTDQANKSRLVTMCRWVVEVINGRFKRDFRLLRNVHSNRALSHMMEYFRIAAALLNDFHVLIDDNVHAEEFLQIIDERITLPNRLADLVITNNYNRRRTHFQSMTADMPQFSQFPRLTAEQLILFALGSYQIKQARSYYGEHLQPDGAFIIELGGDLPAQEVNELDGTDLMLIRGRIQSRHVRAKTYNVYIAVEPSSSGREAIRHYYCSCNIGKRTLGCCSHVMSIIWYMSYARHEPTIAPPAQGLENIIVRQEEL